MNSVFFISSETQKNKDRLIYTEFDTIDFNH